MKVEGLFIYPIKSCQGISLDQLELNARGPMLDREWLIVNDDGLFITQRQYPQLAKVQIKLLEQQGLEISSEKIEPVRFSYNESCGNVFSAKIWKSIVQVHEISKEVSLWFSTFLNTSCKLVGFFDPKNHPRFTSKAPEKTVGFADGYPILLTSIKSLEDLNQKLPSPVPMQRFRANIVVSGLEEYVEETISDFILGEISFQNVKPCSRCPVINIDQNSGIQDLPKGSPLQILGKYRNSANGVVFGINLIHYGLGSIHLGDVAQQVRYLEKSF